MSLSEPDQAIYVRAIDLLSRREHSVKELRNKLDRKFPDKPQEIRSICDLLERQGYLSDHRFAEAYIRSRSAKGFGPRRVRMELKERGVSETLIKEYYENLEPNCSSADADATLLQLWQKKFGAWPETPEQRSKQIRFLVYRGYGLDEVNRLFDRLQSAANGSVDNLDTDFDLH